MAIKVKRVYEEPAKADGFRVLVDRLWPRGLTKEKAKVDLWLKEVGPSHELRKWFGHDPAKWDGFRRRYAAELKASPDLAAIAEKARQGTVTLLFASKEEKLNNATALKELLERKQG